MEVRDLPSPKTPRDRAAKRLALLLVSVGLTATVLEVGARTYIRRFGDDAAFLRYASVRELNDPELAARRALAGRRHVSHRYLGYTTTPAWEERYNRHN